MLRARDKANRRKPRFSTVSRAKLRGFLAYILKFLEGERKGEIFGGFSIFDLKMSRLWFFEKPGHFQYFSKNTAVCFKIANFETQLVFSKIHQFSKNKLVFRKVPKSALRGHFSVSKNRIFRFFENGQSKPFLPKPPKNPQRPPKTPCSIEFWPNLTLKPNLTCQN